MIFLGFVLQASEGQEGGASTAAAASGRGRSLGHGHGTSGMGWDLGHEPGMAVRNLEPGQWQPLQRERAQDQAGWWREEGGCVHGLSQSLEA